MSRKRRSQPVKPRRRWGWLPLAVAYAVAALCVAGGVLVLVYGTAEPQDAEEAIAGSVTRLGAGLIALGLLAAALTGFMHWSKRRG